MYSRLPELLQQPLAATNSPINITKRTFVMGRILNEVARRARPSHHNPSSPEAGEHVMNKSLKGQLILDDGKLRGSFFHRTVILICQHDEDGAFGLVLNRETGNKVGDAVVANLSDSIKQQSLFLGGPVQPQAMTFLHSDVFNVDANVMPNLRMDQALDALMELSESYSPSRQLKIFAGYAGWSPGQLESEISRDL